eukprot:gene48257-59098_t
MALRSTSPTLPPTRVPTPMALVTTSGSGLDPHLPLAAARYQIPRIAEARGIPAATLERLVEQQAERPLIGPAVVNVDAGRADALLAELPREGRGRLKVFLGAAPGVGKTFAMLQAAQAQLRQGVDLRVGVVETHGRAETEAMLTGLPQQPLRRLEYRGVPLTEMDLDGILAAPPKLVLVDELAHSNAPGSRHAKRWQDVQELLAAGIDVYTTVNVQHLEALNDQVFDITGVQVRETLPDWVLQESDEILLVDLPPRELLERLRANGRSDPLLVRLADGADEFVLSASLFRQENAPHFLIRLTPAGQA